VRKLKIAEEQSPVLLVQPMMARTIVFEKTKCIGRFLGKILSKTYQFCFSTQKLNEIKATNLKQPGWRGKSIRQKWYYRPL